jgi:hypothetical protein
MGVLRTNEAIACHKRLAWGKNHKFRSFFMIRNAKGFIIRSNSAFGRLFLACRAPCGADKIGLRRDQGLMFAATRDD